MMQKVEPVFVPTMPLSLSEAIRYSGFIRHIEGKNYIRRMLYNQFDVEEYVRIHELSDWSLGLAPWTCIIDNGYAEDKLCNDINDMARAFDIVEADTIVFEYEEDTAAGIIGSYKRHPLLNETDTKFLIALSSPEFSLLKEEGTKLITPKGELSKVLKYTVEDLAQHVSVNRLIWGIPKSLKSKRKVVVDALQDVLLRTYGRGHIHLLGIYQQEEDEAIISKVDSRLDVSIDSTWPVYQILAELMVWNHPKDSKDPKKFHSYETWGFLNSVINYKRTYEGKLDLFVEVGKRLSAECARWERIRHG